VGGSHLRRELVGIALTLFAVFLVGALVAHAFGPADGGGGGRGAFGVVGRLLANPLVFLLGWAGTVFVPVVFAVHALRLFGRLDQRTDRSWLVFLGGVALLMPVVAALALDVGREQTAATGIWGAFMAYYVAQWFGGVGAWLLVLFLASVLTAATLAWNPLRVLLARAPAPLPRMLAEVGPGVDLEPAPAKRRRMKAGAAELAEVLAPAPEEMPALEPSLMRDVEEADPAGLSADPELAELSATERRKREKKGRVDARAANEERIAAELSAADEELAEMAVDLPSVELLTPPPPRNAEAGKRELDAAGVKLMDALRTFKVEGKLVGRTTGPTVTQFEVEPASGVKVRQIAALADDLALAMRAQSIRIVAPIPGRGAVGVEVPNPSPEMVTFREMLESPEYKQARAALPIALGKDLEGRPVIADLAKMPHLLIAGATGSGKSVCVNTIITSLAYRHTPKTLRFLMVDPKMVELSVYNTLPHLRHKVITDNRDAAAVLKWAVMEMQERYQLLAENGCRNIQDFNRRVQDGAPLRLPKRPDVAFEHRVYTGGVLPYIVVVIDEMADLMMTVQAEVETPIAMLAQKARAIGIHLILATQRPSVNVITGLIKANFPSRIAFRVASQIDSRTIIDGAGAEMLLGNGDMLFIPPGKSEPSRLQGAYLSSEDTERLMAWYDSTNEAKRTALEARRMALEAEGLLFDDVAEDEPDILETVREREAKDGASGEDGDAGDAGDRDKLFRDAAEVVIQHQQGSTSLLQRRLNVGYGRAARIIDQLHAAGVLGPPNGSKARDVLVGLEELERLGR
jgi:S-DNA-T family DNA segregation ATPase FtsK/SpoIIIE